MNVRALVSGVNPAKRSLPSQFGRYRVDRLLGEGAYGLVFAVEDPDSKVQVALKVLRPGFGKASDLKREFRSVADLVHPNLVLPYALETDGEEVFFTMELVEDASTLLEFIERQGPVGEARNVHIRVVFRQLAEGLVALHQRGLLHRDIKPSNVLVDRAGRIRVLDFGLARPMETPFDFKQPNFAGTPAYVAPELFGGGEATPQSDGYSVGVLLHQALTGEWPFHADVRESIIRRCKHISSEMRSTLEDAGPPNDTLLSLASAPPDLARICRALLEPDPSSRPALIDVLRDLGVDAPPRSVRFGSGGNISGTVILERDDELTRLDNAFAKVREEKRSIIVRIPGQSGMGKSTLLHAYSRRVRDAWVVIGRAFERDSVPYKAIDAAIDQLAERIALSSEEERKHLLPADPEGLLFLFPELAQAFGLAESGAAESQQLFDPVARRVRGVRALRDLLARVSDRLGLVVILDDVQWGDADSARLLIELMAPPGPNLLLLLAYRAEQTETPFLTLFKGWEIENISSITLPIEPLSESSALRVTQALAARSIGYVNGRALDVAKASAGCPFLIDMLLSELSPDEPRKPEGTFETALTARIDALPESTRRMLAAVCLAARPLARDRVPFTPKVATDAWTAWTTLSAGRWLRSSGRDTEDLVEAYHDRIRDAVTRSLSETVRRSTHLALGESFAAVDDAEGAAVHLAAAGDHERARTHAIVAAKAAHTALAFDRAAQLYALALECSPVDDDARRALVLSRARALTNARRGTEAAPLFLECAAQVEEGLTASNLRREAMEQFLIVGRLDEGRPVMERLLRDLSVWYPRSAWLTKAALYAELGRLYIRGPKLNPKSRELSETDRLLLETFGSIGKGFASYDASLGAWFFLRSARLALDWGEPKIGARGIAYVATLLGFSGSTSGRKSADKWVIAGEQIANQANDGHSFTFCQVAKGMIECCSGEWANAIRTFDSAAHSLETKHAASRWEAITAKVTTLFALMQLGDLVELSNRGHSFTREAREQKDLAFEVESNLYLALVALSEDRPTDAHRVVDRSLALWTVQGYHFQHWIGLRFRCHSWLYTGEYEKALAKIDYEFPQAQEANLTAMQVVRVEAHDLHGRAALGLVSRKPEAVAIVKRDIAQLHKEKRPYATGAAEMLTAGLAMRNDDAESTRTALEHLERARVAYEEASMTTHALVASWIKAKREGKPTAEVEGIEEQLRARGVSKPGKWARMHLATAPLD